MPRVEPRMSGVPRSETQWSTRHSRHALSTSIAEKRFKAAPLPNATFLQARLAVCNHAQFSTLLALPVGLLVAMKRFRAL